MLDKTFAYFQVLQIDKQNPIRLEAEEEVKLLRSLPEIVLLAGSARFKQAFEDCAFRLAMEGCIVLGKHVFKPGADWPFTERERDMIHAVQFRMCDLAGRVHILNVDSYVGRDTYNLIKYAIRTETPITFHENRVQLIGTSERVTTSHFMQGTRRTVEFEQAAVG